MKLLWITNTPFPEIYHDLGLKAPVTVGWVYADAAALFDYTDDINLAVASFYSGNEYKKVEKNGVVHYNLPSKLRENIKGEKIDSFWKMIRDEFEPDVVHIHGTEYTHSYSYVKACGVENVIVSIQGLVSVYERYYYGNIDKLELTKSITIRDIVRKDTIFSQWRNMYKRGVFEKLLIEQVNHFMGRTSWDRDHVWALNSKATYHHLTRSLRPIFYKKKWDIDNCERNSIFISQAQYPIKGFHQLIKALPIILKHYPDTKVYVAGHNFFSNRGIRINGFGNYINNLIRRGNLSEQIIFTGLLSEDQICERFLRTHVFVCPSAIENSPNSVAEAQLLGLPCVASYVGGNSDMIEHGETGLLYRFEEIEMLASSICRIFSNRELALSLSEKSKLVASKRHNKIHNGEQLYQIYSRVYKKK
ncbi:glycosyltransferase family 4 protein [Sunxiuqinia sp. A32]|uniref:glycosyltransferase family 4 protein n=1 Tax=Sunxiuqinia sp. A32 TaxID=3461496 RepID=UPI0040465FA5